MQKPHASLNPRMLGQAFRAERRARGLTQQRVAETAGCRRQTIVDLEAGRNVALYSMFAVLAALGKGIAITDSRPDVDHIHLLLDPADER